MLRITRLTDYATNILTHMAGLPETLFSAKTLSGELNIGAATVSKILKILLAAELVRSFRGAEGGYLLAAEPKDIPVTRIIEAFEGPLAITECALVQYDCSMADECHVQGPWKIINQVIVKALKGVTLADMQQKMPDNTFVINAKDILTALRGEVNS